MKKTKKRIQKEFRTRIGLLIDYPKQGSGNSNDGNTARRFFRDPELASEITGVDSWLICKFSIILQTLACGMRVDVEKFEEYTRNTLILYLDLYAWFYMATSVHKIFFHGHNQVLRANPYKDTFKRSSGV